MIATNKRTFRARILLHATIAVFLLSCTFADRLVRPAVGPAASTSSQFQWETFTDQANGFSIDYPSTWFYYRSGSANDGAGQGNFVLFSSALGNTDIQNRSEDEEARLVVNTLPNENLVSVESWLAGSPLLQADVTRLSVNGFDAIRIVTSPEDEADHSLHIFLFLTTSTRRYSLVGVVSSSPNAALWQDAILRMQGSFKADP
jgi:hypothetical protein